MLSVPEYLSTPDYEHTCVFGFHSFDLMGAFDQ